MAQSCPTLWSHGLQHAILSCPSWAPRAYSNSCLLSWWWTGRPGVLQFMGSQSWTRLSHWTELNNVITLLPHRVLKIHLLIYLAGPGLSCGMWDLQSSWQHVGSCSLTRDQTQAPCTGSVESQPLDHQGSPLTELLKGEEIYVTGWAEQIRLVIFFLLPVLLRTSSWYNWHTQQHHLSLRCTYHSV